MNFEMQDKVCWQKAPESCSESQNGRIANPIGKYSELFERLSRNSVVFIDTGLSHVV
jgi:hypothetical protein